MSRQLLPQYVFFVLKTHRLFSLRSYTQIADAARGLLLKTENITDAVTVCVFRQRMEDGVVQLY